jgi:D-alanyl-D-alanine carboxypeptidase
MKKNFKNRIRRVSVICLLALLLSVLSGCLTPPQNAPSTQPPTGQGHLYETVTYTYKTDANAFLRDITTGMSADYLMLVNKQYALTAQTDPMSGSYPLEGLVVLTDRVLKSDLKLEGRAARALAAMFREMEADGVTDIYVTSAYRSESYQNMLFNSYYNNEKNTISTEAIAFFGEEYIQTVYRNHGLTKLSEDDARTVANFYSAFPGQSEHHTGLAVDFVTSTVGLTEAFAYTEAYAWLSQNAYRFGFILRYPEAKESVTGYCYEPWHFRFVGREAATEMYFRGLTLEEFLGVA